MGDKMDPCECIWSQELAMRRLLSFLRQGQGYCTDSECVEDMPRLGQSTETADNFILMSVVMLFAIILYTMRPRRTRPSDEKASPNQGPSDQPPPPPPAAPTN